MNERISRTGWLIIDLAVLLCYVAATNLGQVLSDPVSHVTPIWPAAGITMAALLRFGARRMFWPVAACVSLEMGLYCLRTGIPFYCGVVTANICGPMAGALLLERFADGGRFMENPAHTMRFVILGAGCSGAVSALLGTLSIHWQGIVPWPRFSDIAVPWCVSDVIGTLLLAPLLLAWTNKPISLKSLPSSSRGWEMAALFTVAGATTQIAFSGWPLRFEHHALEHRSLEYLCLPVLLWAAFRFPGRGSTTVTAGISALALIDTLAGRGPFSEHSYSLTLLQLYLGCISLLSLATAAVVTERATQERALHTQGEALRAAAAAADRANRAKSEFLSRMSHELRTPLNAILGFAQLLEIEDPNPIQGESIQHILKGGRHLLSLINEVLDLARVEAGHLHIFPEPLDAGEIFRDSIELVTPLIRERGLTLETHFCPSDGHQVMADQQRLKQILVNLLSNAVKFNREGGVITASCSLHPAADRENRRVMRMSVRDTGPGIAVENQVRIFTAFDRGSADQNRVEGTGLGLALARQLAGLMGGTLTLESIVDEGSLFVVELPCAEGTIPPPASESSSGESWTLEPEPSRRKVLYVEDDPASLALVRHLLAGRTDLKLLSAVRGGDGLPLAFEHTPDLILLDLDLPDLHGHEVLAALRADERTRGVPVLIISANTLPQTVEQMLASGATAYFTKPIDTQGFLRAVDAHLQANVPRLAVSSV